jgi:hypothetical protein
MHHIRKDSLENFTLETMALEPGFANRSTFKKNFKEVNR